MSVFRELVGTFCIHAFRKYPLNTKFRRLVGTYRPNREKFIWDGINRLTIPSAIPSQLQKSALGRYKTGENTSQKPSAIPSQLRKTHLGRCQTPEKQKNKPQKYRPKRQKSNWDGTPPTPNPKLIPSQTAKTHLGRYTILKRGGVMF